MKKILLLFIIISLLGCHCIQNQSNKLTVEEIWENYLAQFGSKEDVEKISTISQVTKSKLLKLNRIGTIESTIKNNMIRLHYKDDELDVTTVFDGKNFARYCNGVNQEVTEIEEIVLKKYADFSYERNYKKYGNKIELVGSEIINKRPAYIVKLYSNDWSSLYYIDKNDFSLIKIKNPEDELWPIEIKSKDGISYISKMISIDQYDTNEVEVVSMEFNKEINDSIFQLK